LSPITPFECCPMAGQSKALTAEDAENAENTKANERLCTMRVERFKYKPERPAELRRQKNRSASDSHRHHDIPVLVVLAFGGTELAG